MEKTFLPRLFFRVGLLSSRQTIIDWKIRKFSSFFSSSKRLRTQTHAFDGERESQSGWMMTEYRKWLKGDGHKKPHAESRNWERLNHFSLSCYGFECRKQRNLYSKFYEVKIGTRKTFLSKPPARVGSGGRQCAWVSFSPLKNQERGKDSNRCPWRNERADEGRKDRKRCGVGMGISLKARKKIILLLRIIRFSHKLFFFRLVTFKFVFGIFDFVFKGTEGIPLFWEFSSYSIRLNSLLIHAATRWNVSKSGLLMQSFR